tara:strand:+ start:86468 stop:86620 length:153 start_codon:yes stop_codon:yes gene_type:complete
MSWTRYLLHDFWTAREFNKMDDAQRSSRKSARLRRQRSATMNKQLEGRID